MPATCRVAAVAMMMKAAVTFPKIEPAIASVRSGP